MGTANVQVLPHHPSSILRFNIGRRMVTISAILSTMITLLHILIASASIVVTTVIIFRPSKLGLWSGYALIGATLASGVYLVWSEPAHMLTACTSGLAYVTVVAAGTFLARAKLRQQTGTHANILR